MLALINPGFFLLSFHFRSFRWFMLSSNHFRLIQRNFLNKLKAIVTVLHRNRQKNCDDKRHSFSLWMCFFFFIWQNIYHIIKYLRRIYVYLPSTDLKIKMDFSFFFVFESTPFYFDPTIFYDSHVNYSRYPHKSHLRSVPFRSDRFVVLIFISVSKQNLLSEGNKFNRKSSSIAFDFILICFYKKKKSRGQ